MGTTNVSLKHTLVHFLADIFLVMAVVEMKITIIGLQVEYMT